ncbi:MAG: type IV pilus assembly protein PilM [Candidatus Saccharibacteria bacterium]
MGILSSATDFIGIDIGSSGIRIVQLKHMGSGNPVLVAYAKAALPAGIATSDSQIDQDQVSLAIANLLKEAKITATQAVTGINTADAFVTTLSTPQLNAGELAKAMRLQADQYIPMAIDQVKMDWNVIGQGKTPDQMKVLLVAAPNTVVNKYLAIIEKAGLQLAALEINSVAQTRSLMPKTDLTTIILDLGQLSTELTIVDKQAPQLVRSVNIGGTTLVRAVSQALGLDDVQAEQFTKKFGLTQTKLEGQVAKAMKPSLDALVTEINNSIKYFMTENPTAKIEKMIVTGESITLPELTNYLANATGLPVELGNPWGNISYPAAQQQALMGEATSYAVAAGLALRESL